MAFNYKKLSDNFERDAKNILFREIKNMHSISDLEKFFSQFFTEKEKSIFLKRIIMKDFLISGKKYRDIKKILDVSSNTISNVKDIIEKRGYGRNPNRKRVYSKDKKKTKARRESMLPKYKGAQSIV